MSAENPTPRPEPDPPTPDEVLETGSVTELLKQAREDHLKGKGRRGRGSGKAGKGTKAPGLPFEPNLMKQRFHAVPLPTRLTVLTQVYHQRPGREPTKVEGRSLRELVSSEQPYTRELTFGGEWRVLEYGWVEDPGTVTIAPERSPFAANPSPEERAAETSKVLELGIALPPSAPAEPPAFLTATYTPLGDVLVWNLARGTVYAVRCLNGTARCVLTVFPR